MLWVALHFPSLPAATLENLAAWTCQFTPRVSLEPPQALLAEVQGSLRYFTGLKTLVRKLQQGMADLGFEARLGLARTPRAALWRARSGETRLPGNSFGGEGNRAGTFFKNWGAEGG